MLLHVLKQNLDSICIVFHGESLGEELADLYVEYKTDEWARFCGAVTEWERDLYWDDLP